MKRRFRTVLAIFLVALVLRAGYALTRPAEIEFPDGRDYHAIAQNFLAGNGLIEGPDRQASRAPGYPLFLAALYKTLPARTASVLLTQAVIGAFTCLLIMRFGSRCFNPTAGLMAGCIACVYPFFIFYTGRVLAETLFILLLVLGMYLLETVRPDESAAEPSAGSSRIDLRRERAFAAGLVLGLAVLVRASLLLFFPFYMVLWLICSKRRTIALARGAIVGLGICIAMLPWWCRNYRVFGRLVPSTLQVGESLYEANSPGADGGPRMDQIDWEGIGGKLDEYDRNTLFRDKALAYMARNPSETARLALVKLGRFWNVVPNYENYRTPIYCAISVLSYVPAMLLGIGGLALSLRSWRRYLPLLSPVLYYALLHMLFVGSIRYRTPVMPFVMLFGGYGAARLLQVLQRRRSAVETETVK